MRAIDLQVQRLRDQLGIDVAAEAAGVVGVVGDIEAIEELAIEPPGFDVQVIGPEPRIPRRLHGEVRHLVQAEIVGVVEEAAARPGQVDQKIRDSARPAARPRACRRSARCRRRMRSADFRPTPRS